jgi:hypothetical protein
MEPRHSWGFLHLLGLHACGFVESELSDLFNSIPEEIGHVMRRALDLQQRLSWQRNPTQKELYCIPGNIPMELEVDDFNSAMWELDDECGIFQISIIPETCKRRQISLNSRYASIVSTRSKEVVLDAHEQNECNLFYPHSDFLLLLVDDILHDFRDRVRYFRLMKWADPNAIRGIILISCAVSREFNWFGQLSKVPHKASFILESNFC